MNQNKRYLLIFMLQFIPIIIYPPATLGAGLALIGVVFVIYMGLAYGLWRGRSWALLLSIFLQGLNIIVRVMMLFPHAIRAQNVGGGVDVLYIVLALLSILLSGWFLLRLDRPDIRATIMT